MLFGCAHATFDEWHQSFVPGRSSDLADWIADVAGVMLGVLFVAWRGLEAWPFGRPGSPGGTER